MLPPLPRCSGWAYSSLLHPPVSAFPATPGGSACTLVVSRLARRSLTLRPAHAHGHQVVTALSRGFRHFVTSMPAPVASGWSVRRVGLSPTGKRRLSRRTGPATTGTYRSRFLLCSRKVPCGHSTYRSRFLLCSRKVPCGHSMRRHSVQIHNSIPNSNCNPAHCRFEAAPLVSIRTCWLSAVAVARCRTHDPAAGRRPLNWLSASAGFLPQRAIVHQLGRRQARHRDLVETPSCAAAAQRFPLRRSLPRIRPTDSGPPVAYGSLRPQPVAEVSTLWYRLVSNPAPGLISASRSVLPR
jgi:hypothetical protein